MTYTSPDIDWIGFLPVMIVLGAAVVGVLIEAFVRRPTVRHPIQVTLGIGAALASASAAAWLMVDRDGAGSRIAGTLFVLDRFSLVWQVMIAVFAALGIVLFASRNNGQDAFTPLGSAAPGSAEESLAERRGFAQTEVFPLALFATGGMMLFSMVNDTIVLFVVLEVLSLPLYILVALARRRRLLSHEAALKYFLLGAFSSAVYLFGAALMYGFSQATHYDGISVVIAGGFGEEPLLFLGVIMMIAGLLFKLGAVPFHAWSPDAYQGAPTPVAGFMAAATKAAAAAALLRLLYVGFYRIEWELAPMLWTVAIASMVVGTVVAMAQSDIKRMLAFSSVAHAGFIVVALTSFEASAVAALPFYMAAYGLATLGAFAVVGLVRERTPAGAIDAEATRLGQWAGLGKRSPLLAAAMALFLLSFAGIPLTAGFVGKFVAFKAAIEAGAWPLVLVAVLASGAAAFFYVRLLVLMFLTPVPEDLEDTVAVQRDAGPLTVIGIAALGTVVLGVVPAWALDIAADAAVLVP